MHNTSSPARNMMPFRQYRAFPRVELKDRTWPDKRIEVSPKLVSVDLRDGNQALINPMDVETKLRFFGELVRIGFTEIEVGFPASSEIEFEFIRRLIDENRIPEHVTIQVLTQSREELIRRTFEALKGVPRAIVHLYNSTSELQRRVVFNLDKEGIIEIATTGATLIKELAALQPETDWTFEYSPESFTGTELEFAKQICDAVTAIWQPTRDKKVIINLPATVEMSSPNLFADMIEWMHRYLARRDSIILSLHPHNDRGMGVAAAELGIMAGGERIEGTLFGNGERTGNVDIVTFALNRMTEGVDPELNLSDIPALVRLSEDCTGIEVHPRHPYAGELAFVAMSGSHQDAIKKGTDAMSRRNSDIFEVPYIPIDPRHIGREYRPVRVNSQSGKGGVAYLMKELYHLDLPRGLQIELSGVVQKATEVSGGEMLPEQLWSLFMAEYLERDNPLRLVEHSNMPGKTKGIRVVQATVIFNGVEMKIEGEGNGVVNAFVNALAPLCATPIDVLDLFEHAVSSGAASSAVSYIPISVPGRESVWGVGMNNDTTKAHLLAVVCAVNRAIAMQ